MSVVLGPPQRVTNGSARQPSRRKSPPVCHHLAMAPGTDRARLRTLVTQVVRDLCGAATHTRLDDELARFGLPLSDPDGTKAQRADSSLAAMTDEQVPVVAQQLLNGYECLSSSTRNQLQDLLWAGQTHPTIPQRQRREVARQLGLEVHRERYGRFRELLGTLFVLDDHELFGAFTAHDTGLGGRIDLHVGRNDDWTAEELFDDLGAFDASDRRFALLLEGMVSSAAVPDEDAQRRLVAAINPPLAAAGLELREVALADGYPVFELVSTRSRAGRPKQLIFASPMKPDLRLSDAIDNDIEIMSDADDVLVYDRPITAQGIRWRDLQDWWKETRGLNSDEQAKSQLYRRLLQSLPGSSPPQQLLFRLYHEIHAEAVHDLPALLPEVWLHWDPRTVKARGAAALLNLRMDFLLLVPSGGRIVLEVDGKTHYAIGDRADPGVYARTMAGHRDLTLAGYEVHRFGAHDLRTVEQARPVLSAFFVELFKRHHVTAGR
jgi:hypothetical protein